MIVRPKVHWFRMLFVWRGSVLGLVMPRLLGILAISLLALAGHLWFRDFGVRLNPAPFSLVGIALAIFLGFRNNVSYDRFWEGRRLWGQLVIASRALSRQAATLVALPDDDPRARHFAALLIALAHSLKHQLRGDPVHGDLARLLPADLAARCGAAQFVPVALLTELARWVQERRREGQLPDILAANMDANLDSIAEVITGCERIANTPIPYAYNVLLHRTVYGYAALLPFGLVDSIGYLTPLMAVFVAYTFMALEAIAGELEDPFGREPNDLALDALARTIERTVLETVGVPSADLPPALQPDGNYRLT